MFKNNVGSGFVPEEERKKVAYTTTTHKSPF